MNIDLAQRTTRIFAALLILHCAVASRPANAEHAPKPAREDKWTTATAQREFHSPKSAAALAKLDVGLDWTNAYHSPDDATICFKARGEEGRGQEFYLSGNRGEAPILVWTSRKWAEVAWSADSKYLAITDHLSVHSSVVLVFYAAGSKVGGPFIVCQTTPEKDEQWSVSKWNADGKSIQLTKTDSKDPKKSELRTLPFSVVRLKQNVYAE